VGSMPQFDDPKSALRWQVDELAGRIARLTGGETGFRLLWFVYLVKELKALPEVRALRDGDWSDYDNVDRLAVRPGRTLTVERIPLRFGEYAHEELEIRRALATDLPLQVGIPGYLDMALFTFGPLAVFRLAPKFLDAVARQIAGIRAEAGDDVVFQLEVPAALIALAAAPLPLRAAMAALMARFVTRQVAKAPAGSRFGVHLCLGDMGHKALRQMNTADPLVRLANAIARQWPAGRRLEYVHMPMSGGDQPPTTEPSFYEPLRRLEIPAPVVAGIGHENQAIADQRLVRDLVEHALGRQVDISTSCGLGRRTPEQAEQAVARMRELLD
jgi:hypothetical protein